jgi:transglutaminase-like putative cysteine protease
MFPVKKLLQLTMLMLVLTSGIVLGLSQGNLELTLVAAIGGISGYVICDCLQVFRLRGLLANIASILVLIYAMRNFFGTDGGAKLICVSNLLVYLQTVLMFQEKTPRLNWQLMTLSLLQIVVAAIFNLNFEGGLLFVFYFCVVGVTMILQTIYSNNWDIILQNRGAATIVGQYLDLQELPLENRKNQSDIGRPAVFFDVMHSGASDLKNIVQHLMLWVPTALVFATILFYVIPRSGEAWFGPSVVLATGTGMSKQVDLNERGLIELSTALVMRGWFEDPITGENFRPKGQVYFRGLALGNLSTKNGHTNWTAPYDRITPATYQKIRSDRNIRNAFIQRVMLQPTNDPLLYGSMPVYRHELRSPNEIEFCFELDALSRRNGKNVIEKAPFSYELTTVLSNERETLEAWPYLSDQIKLDDRPMDTHNRGQRAWLTKIDRNRYPTVTKIAGEVAARVGDQDRLKLVKELEKYFTESTAFQYTLDFTNVPRDESLDAVEDFLRNHKRGHCELYASTLTLMLRSLDIPARLVVGFFGSEYDEDSHCFMVREADAHAWVEVYLRPSDCTPKMLTQGAAGPGGAWLRLDPTPPSALANPNRGSTTIDSARTLWQDYVLGLDQKKQQKDIFGSSSARVLGLFDLSGWNHAFQNATDQLAGRPGLQAGFAAAILMVMVGGLFMGWYATRRKSKRRGISKKKQSGLRRMLGGALSFISPELGKWLLGESPQGVSSWFYRRLTKDLAAVGLSRKPGQTQREFARLAAEQFSEIPDGDSIGNTIHGLTELFYRVRFGTLELDHARQHQVKQMLDSLESKLKNFQLKEQNSLVDRAHEDRDD